MSKQANLFGEASGDEVLAISGGFSGDQSGFELDARTWYLRPKDPWNAVYRFNNEEDREFIATFFEHAITNGYIGYDTSNRTSFFNQVTALPTKDPSYVDQNVETDCSALLYAALYCLTGIAWDYENDPNADGYTHLHVRHIDYYLMNQLSSAGYDITKFEDDSHLYSSDYLMRGDVIKNVGHCGVWL